MKYDLELFNKGNHYIKLETQEKYDEVMKYLDKNGYTWQSGYSLRSQYYWKDHKELTSIKVESIKRIVYAYYDYYIAEGKKELKAKEPKQDLIKLLKVGYKVDTLPERLTQGNIDDMIKIDFDFNEIYRPKYNGIKPMEWALVWKREEELFTLQTKTVDEKYFCQDLDHKEECILLDGFAPFDVNRFKKEFTQKEIEELPHQDLIAALNKKPVQ